jgi:hypothetical protein
MSPGAAKGIEMETESGYHKVEFKNFKQRLKDLG